MLYLIVLAYLRLMAGMDNFTDAHRAFLKTHYEVSHFLISGREKPRTDGIVLVKTRQRTNL